MQHPTKWQWDVAIEFAYGVSIEDLADEAGDTRHIEAAIRRVMRWRDIGGAIPDWVQQRIVAEGDDDETK